jgi:glycerol-3-phosphate dehydrogenase
MGLIVPKTRDGRVVFMLPWLDRTIAGTTDEKCELTDFPFASEAEEKFILTALSDYLRVEVRPSDVLATWSGIRPLARDPKKKDTQSLSRNHVIVDSSSGLVTITGGKWTTYRRMAQDVADHVTSTRPLPAKSKCVTKQTQIVGAFGWDEALFTQLTQRYKRVKRARGNETVGPMDTDIAMHLSECYGTRAFRVAELAQTGFGKRLAHNHPYLEAEVIFAVRHEFALTASDVIARRTRLAFIDSKAAEKALPRVVDIMADELGWDSGRKKKELKAAFDFVKTLSLSLPNDALKNIDAKK